MNRNKPGNPRPRETAASRRRRLQDRLDEISQRSDQELRALTQSLDKIKAAFRSNKS